MAATTSLHGAFTETLSFKELGAAKWETHHPPQRMGNAADIAYGGFAVAVAAQAACKSVPESYHLYTLMGNFLGPAFTDRPLRASTRMLRKTRTFVTCQVEVSQLIAGKDGRPEDRICLIALADFQVQEKGNVLEYCAPPRQKYSHYDGLPGVRSNSEKLVEEGKVSKDEAQGFWTSFGLHDALFDSRPCPEGIFAQNLNGRSKKVETTQEGLHVTEKSTADWVRCRTPLPTQADHRTAMAFLMDSALSFTPLAFSQMYLDDTAACSSLDFALRLFSNSINLEAWHLRELVTHVGAEGRTYSEARIWDENRRCVGNMTQQGIMRALPGAREKGKL